MWDKSTRVPNVGRTRYSGMPRVPWHWGRIFPPLRTCPHPYTEPTRFARRDINGDGAVVQIPAAKASGWRFDA